MKVSFKINLVFTIIVTGIVLVIAGIIYNISSKNIRDDFRALLKIRAARTDYLYNTFRYDTTNLLKTLDSNRATALINKNIYLFSAEREMLYEYHDDSTDLLQIDTTWFDIVADRDASFFTQGEKDICLYHNPNGTNGHYVLIASENKSGAEYINDLKNLFLFYLPVAILVTIIAGYLFSKSLVRPVKETIKDVKLITSQNLSHRLYVGERKDELGELNSTFNDLLNRLEESFAIQRRFISNASHELSTPLTSVSSQIEVALLHNRSEDEYRRVLGSVLEDVKDLQQLTKTLLEIAKAGTHGAISLEKARIDELLIKAHTEVMKQNPGSMVNLEFADFPENENECLVFGNSLLLISAIKNIMENGCKYSPDKTVNSQLFFHGNAVELVFSNRGEMIERDEVQKLFEPFYRGNNAEGKPGVGLGLTLTRRIISLHKGEMTMQSRDDKGTVVRITLPTMSN